MFFFFCFDPYIAIIGDIVDSRHASDRKEVQIRLKTVLEEVNNAYGNDIASKFMVTLGDEFQGLLKSGSPAMEILEKIEFAMFPVKIRIGVGVGSITTDIDPNMPLGADGPAYYCAREMINELRSLEKKNRESRSDILIKIEDHAEISSLINTVFTLSAAIKSEWTNRQREIIHLYGYSGKTQKEVADFLHINQSNVQKALAGSNYYAYRKSMDTVTGILSGIGGEKHV